MTQRQTKVETLYRTGNHFNVCIIVMPIARTIKGIYAMIQRIILSNSCYLYALDESPGSGNQSVPNGANGHFPVPAPRGVTPSSQNQIQPGQNNFPTLPDVPGLPSVPVNSVGVNSVAGDDVDFDDLTRRFEELKRKK